MSIQRLVVGEHDSIVSHWPAEGSPVRAVVVVCHGGLDGLDDAVSARCAELAQLGCFVVAPHYRGEDGDPTSVRVAGKTDVEDVLEAGRWALAETGMTPTVWGNSRGGLVGLLAAGHANFAIDKLALSSPITSLAMLHTIMAPRLHPVVDEIEALCGGSPGEVPTAYEFYDPASFVSQLPPVFIAHSEDDSVVDVAASRELVSLAGSHSVPVTTHFVETGGHRAIFSDSAMWEHLCSFLVDGTPVQDEPTTSQTPLRTSVSA